MQAAKELARLHLPLHTLNHSPTSDGVNIQCLRTRHALAAGIYKVKAAKGEAPHQPGVNQHAHVWREAARGRGGWEGVVQEGVAGGSGARAQLRGGRIHK